MEIERIKALSQKYSNYIIDLRKYFHAYPELSFSEILTAEKIEKELISMGLHPIRIGKTGVSAIINGAVPAETVIALRADMDALPVQELNQVTYSSTNQGVMHACGHDAHMAMLLGAARILTECKDSFKGTIKLIFQPAEEKIPGGALVMIENGVLENPDVNYVLGQHVLPDLPAGKVGFCPGYFMASSDEIYIRIIGKGGHAAMPWKITDPVSIMAQLITALQQLVSRQTPAHLPAVLSFGKIVANGAVNVIPEEVFIEGTFRTFNEEFRSKLHSSLTKMTLSIVEGMGAKAEIEIRKGYPALFNHPELTQKLQSFASEYLGEENVVALEPRMTAEDFAYFARAKPSVFYRLGTACDTLENYPLHHPRFDIPDHVLPEGAGLLSYLTLSLMK